MYTSICPISFGLAMHHLVRIVLITTGSESPSHGPIKKVILPKFFFKFKNGHLFQLQRSYYTDLI